MAGKSTKKTNTAGSSAKTGNHTGSKKAASNASGRKQAAAPVEPESGFLQSEILILGTFAVCALLFLSNFHICGMIGDFFSSIMLGVFGTIGYVAPILLLAGVVFYASNEGNIRAVYKMLAVEVLLIVLCGLAQMLFVGAPEEGRTLLDIYKNAGETGVGGGLIGGAITLVLHTALGTVGTYIVLLLCVIISMVCITERSFVSVVKKGGSTVYNHAKEDYDRQKEIREQKREQKRILREEQRVQGVDLESTDLSKGTVIAKMAMSEDDEAEISENAAYREAYAAEERALRNAVHTELNGHAGAEAGTAKKSAKAEEDPANVFKGKITMAGISEDDGRTPDEPVKAEPVQHDEDIFVSRDTRTFREMGMFPQQAMVPEIDELLARAEADRAVQEPVPEPTAAFEYEPEHFPEPWYQEEPETVPVSTLRPAVELPSADADEWEEIPAGPVNPYQTEPKLIDRKTESGETFHTPEERKKVVTASGKVIETDTEEIIKQKNEKRRQELAEQAEADRTVLQEIRKTEEKPKKPYVFPSLELLTRGARSQMNNSDQEFRETAIKLQQTLKNFGVGVTVTNISCGPTVTRYELHPEQGVKVSKIQALADDIKLNLAATDIRIEAPIPGKAAVGIEVPNKTNSMVYLRELLESSEFKKHPSRLAFAVGKDIGGQVIVADIAKMPHLLIAGQTGSGKSVGINTMIMSLIYRSSPDDVKLIMIDPKVVELSVYNGIPHLLIPVVTDPKKAAGALNWAVAEMMERYNKFAQSNVRDIKGYNAKVQSLVDAGDVPQDQIPTKLPHLVIIIDELADLMMVASSEVEDAICRLAQLARAAGIHLVIATQRPSVNVITGVIKANVPSRIAFSVASGVDSRTILDMVGAEKLLGNGDMLFYPSGYPKPVRVQGAFVSDAEVTRVTDFLKEQNESSGYNPDLEAKMSQSSFGGAASGGGSDRDSLFTDAGRFIIEKDKASIGMLQRVFKIGFNRAARIMDQLAEAGVVGEEEGTKPRKILMTMDEFNAL